MMTDMVRRELPLLRRYARALTGSQQRGDHLVRTSLEALIADPGLLPPGVVPRVALYRSFHQVCPSAALEDIGTAATQNPFEKTVQARLNPLEPVGRCLLLLTALESFTLPEAAAIVGVPLAEARSALDTAVSVIDLQSKSAILIIEDEPLIAMELESLVTGLGHRVVGNATTHAEAINLFRKASPDLVLADIQLADGSSGINAIKEILEESPVPVIFITAFPERLLTGERPEPTYLISKPFSESSVRAAVSQALFLQSTARPQLASA
jgi:CheY-like chemotaxis protein/DNA-directed RNA polymerase specialized sigma24 family protein